MHLDRKIGSILERYPQVYAVTKTVYLRLAYAITPRSKSRYPAPDNSFSGFFGYFDKSPWSIDNNRYLYHRVYRNDDKECRIMLSDLENNTNTEIDVTQAWNWQQGAMLQWLPGSNAIIYNTIKHNKLAAKIVRLDNLERHIVNMPIQVIHPNGKEGLTLNYRRLSKLAPDYGYNVQVENFSPDQELSQDGIWYFELFYGEPKLIVTLEELTEIEPRPEMQAAHHKVNHILYSPDGSKFVFMHRWIGKGGKFSRLYVGNNPHGNELRILMDERMVSHYTWRDNDNLLVFGRTSKEGDRYYLVNVNTGRLKVIGRDVLDIYGDGHPTYSPDRRWIITDTYPDKARMRHLLLYDNKEDILIKAGSFFAPWKFDGTRRVDLHPRWSPDGTKVSIDSAHEGVRKTYIIGVSQFMG